MRVPVFVVTETKSVGMNFLTHNLLQSVSNLRSQISNFKSQISNLKSEIVNWSSQSSSSRLSLLSYCRLSFRQSQHRKLRSHLSSTPLASPSALPPHHLVDVPCSLPTSPASRRHQHPPCPSHLAPDVHRSKAK